jgi:hypothetical protein
MVINLDLRKPVSIGDSFRKCKIYNQVTYNGKTRAPHNYKQKLYNVPGSIMQSRVEHREKIELKTLLRPIHHQLLAPLPSTLL